MLHDYRLFETHLHYLWEKIVNVIFIREFFGKPRNEQNLEFSYEISTVQFPYPIKSIMLPKRLDIWRQTKFLRGTELFKDKTIDLKNQTLKVVVFAHLPATVKSKISNLKTVRATMRTQSSEFQGIEIEILQRLAIAMNFYPKVYEPLDIEAALWGKKQSDRKYSGLLGEMVKNHADFALGDLHYTRYFLKVMDLCVPYNTECLTFLTPEALTSNSWKTLVLPFKPQLWAVILLSLFVMGFLFHALCKFHDKVNQIVYKDLKSRKLALKKDLESTSSTKIDQKLSTNMKYSILKKKYLMPKVEGEPVGLYVFRSIGNSLLYTYGMLLVISLPKLPTGWSIRMLTGWFWIYCILIVVAYKASMTAILANPSNRVTIDTLQELSNSKLEYGGWGYINLDFFKTSLDVPSQIIGTKFEKVNNSDEAINRITKGTFALFENEYFLKRLLVSKQLRYQNGQGLNGTNSTDHHVIPKGDHHLHIMNECVIHMPISIGLKKNSPIKLRVDKLVRRVFETGLVKKWLDDVMQQTTNDEIHFDSNDETKAIMDLEKFMGAIVALFIGYFISIIVLVWETVDFEVNVKKHPNFNKYTKQIIKSE